MSEQMDTNSKTAASDDTQPQFAIQKIYIKDVSFEAPNLPELYNEEYKPQVKMEMNSKSRRVADDHFEVVLSVTLRAEIGDKVAFLAEVQQAGLFFIKNFTEEQTHQLTGAAAPESLYPYVREVIAGLIGKTGFPSIQLTPVNFMGLYMERQQQMQQAQKNGVASTGEKSVAH